MSFNITLPRKKPRNKPLNSLLMVKSKKSGPHVPKQDKRRKNKWLRELAESL